MNPFPFSEEEWSRVNEAATDIVNHGLMDDPVLHTASVAQMIAILEELRLQHGEHPVLLETLADFQDDAAQSQRLYRQAIDLAIKNGLPTYTARIALARILLEVFHDSDAASQELIECKDEVRQYGDASEQSEWSELMARCAQPKEM